MYYYSSFLQEWRLFGLDIIVKCARKKHQSVFIINEPICSILNYGENNRKNKHSRPILVAIIKERAKDNNKPISQEIASAFLNYLKTERALNVIMKHAELMIDMDTLRKNLNDVASDVGKTLSDAIGAQLSEAVKHLASQLAIQIERAIVRAMTSYMTELQNSFDFSTESLMQVVDANMSAESMKDILTNMLSGTQQTAKSNLKAFGYVDVHDPKSITFYPKDFETKANVSELHTT